VPELLPVNTTHTSNNATGTQDTPFTKNKLPFIIYHDLSGQYVARTR
jgi:hypothetical protein